MPESMSFDDLVAACSPGGASVLTVVTDLAPAAGTHGAVAPAKYQRAKQPAYAYGQRFVDGEVQHVVTIDSKGSSLNRMEGAVANAILDGEEPLASMPRIQVAYENGGSFADYELPHRAFDGHIRAGTVDGVDVTRHPSYRSARDAKAANVRALMDLSPTSLIFGSWDSTRKSNQSRFRSAITGEIIGVLAVQSDDDPETPMMGGARVDPVAASVQVPGPVLDSLAQAQAHEFGSKMRTGLAKDVKKAAKGAVSASRLGLGAIPPALETVGLVACRRIIRSTVLSFSALRQLRFGSPGEGDVAGRAVLAALGLAALARANRELLIRANCDLVEVSVPVVTLDGRNGISRQLPPLSVAEADSLLVAALDMARSSLGLTWEGQVFPVVGNPAIVAGASSDEEDGA